MSRIPAPVFVRREPRGSFAARLYSPGAARASGWRAGSCPGDCPCAAFTYRRSIGQGDPAEQAFRPAVPSEPDPVLEGDVHIRHRRHVPALPEPVAEIEAGTCPHRLRRRQKVVVAAGDCQERGCDEAAADAVEAKAASGPRLEGGDGLAGFEVAPGL